MKKALSFAVALGLVAGMASYAAAADVDFHGDARWRGVSMSNADGDDNVVDSLKAMDQRYRLVMNVNATEDLKVNFRVNMHEDIFSDTSINNMFVDRAYMQINMLGGTYLIGRQEASWGNKFLGWGGTHDRIKGVYKTGDLTYGLYLDKLNESSGNSDTDTYAAFIIGKAGDAKWGVLPNYVVDHSAVAPAPEDGQILDVFFNTKVGAVNLMSEVVYQGGDLFESAAGDAAIGGFVAGMTTMDNLTVKGLVAYYQNNGGTTGQRDCDNDFAPSLLVGTCSESAIIDFGETTNDGSVTVADAEDKTYLVGAGVDLKVDDKLTVGALVGYLHASDNFDQDGVGPLLPDNLNLTEVDLTAAYVLAKGVVYKAGIAYGMWDGISASDDALLSFSNNISVTW